VVVISGNSTIAAGLSDCGESCSLDISISVDADFNVEKFREVTGIVVEGSWEVTELIVEGSWDVTELAVDECWDANELVVELDMWNSWAETVGSVLADCNKVVNSKDSTPAGTIEAVDGIVDDCSRIEVGCNVVTREVLVEMKVDVSVNVELSEVESISFTSVFVVEALWLLSASVVKETSLLSVSVVKETSMLSVSVFEETLLLSVSVVETTSLVSVSVVEATSLLSASEVKVKSFSVSEVEAKSTTVSEVEAT